MVMPSGLLLFRERMHIYNVVVFAGVDSVAGFARLHGCGGGGGCKLQCWSG